jgi:hypothetical protein
MSDSLSETSILNRLTLTSVTNPEDEDCDEDADDAPAPPSPPATEGPELALEPVPKEELDEESLDPALTVSPTEPLTAATVPLYGATIFVASTAFSAFVTVSFALVTAASAAATDSVDPGEPPPPCPL